MPHISIKPEELFAVAGFPVTNSLLSSWIVLLIFVLFAVIYKSRANQGAASGFVFLMRFMIQGLYNMFEGIMKERTEKFFPLLASFFMFILLLNWFSLLPGVGSILVQGPQVHSPVVIEPVPDHATMVPLLRGGTADLNATIAFALISVGLIQYYGVRYLGFIGYMKKFINFKSPIDLFTGVLEMISEVSKIISFAFRLFGNIFAGEVLLVVVAFLVPVFASFPFLLLEIFVGVIQALVFAMLTAVFLNMAIAKHH